jgi:hypothetical protein
MEIKKIIFDRMMEAIDDAKKRKEEINFKKFKENFEKIIKNNSGNNKIIFTESIGALEYILITLLEMKISSITLILGGKNIFYKESIPKKITLGNLSKLYQKFFYDKIEVLNSVIKKRNDISHAGYKNNGVDEKNILEIMELTSHLVLLHKEEKEIFKRELYLLEPQKK